ncbi:hypothetical protein [Embleya sp. NPDC020630]|uniref:hypothetical protein n=1 Tax=Embleya sp. NPDC020630 TaxID=3363979 RepID=UPI003794C309
MAGLLIFVYSGRPWAMALSKTPVECGPEPGTVVDPGDFDPNGGHRSAGRFDTESAEAEDRPDRLCTNAVGLQWSCRR